MIHRLWVNDMADTLNPKKGVPSKSITKDPESNFQPVGIRKGCFKYGHHVIYNSGKLDGLAGRCALTQPVEPVMSS